MNLNLNKIPEALKQRPQWVLWKLVKRTGEPTKVPFSVNGATAKANDSATWSEFSAVVERFEQGGFAGIGFEFSADDGFCGIDLDGCRDATTGEIAEWAKEIILALNTYAEISPSQTGVKLFIRGKSPFESGRKKELAFPKCSDKQPAIEVYDKLRYFAVTGWRLSGPAEPQERSAQLAEVCKKHFTADKPQFDFNSPQAIVERARKYVATMPPAVSGQSGHNITFRVACVLILGFGLDVSQALPVISEWNLGCQPPWSERELLHKLNSASKQTGERNYLRSVSQDKWAAVKIPEYAAAVQADPVQFIELADASAKYIDKLRSGEETLVLTGIPDLDHAIGGGTAFGEMIVIGAVSGHGKTAIALQMAHAWGECQLNSVIISEEMSELMLGKRTLQFIQQRPEEEWTEHLDDLQESVERYRREHARCLIAEPCGTAERAVEAIERAVVEHGVKCAVVDYVGLLRSKGNSRYEQITNTSIALRKVCTKHKLILVLLAQLNRDVEKRDQFTPRMSDIKDSGQLGHDADVVLLCVWPHRIDGQRDRSEYQIFVRKNRNREIRDYALTCQFDASRQMVKGKPISSYAFKA